MLWKNILDNRYDFLGKHYTKKGKKGQIDNIDGSISYFIYWGLGKPIGSDPRAAVVLFNTSWHYSRVHPETVKADEYHPNK